MSDRLVMFVEPYPHVLGGAAVATRLLAVGLKEHGFACEVVAPDDGPVLEMYRDTGIVVSRLHASASLLRYGDDVSQSTRVRRAASLLPWWRQLRSHLRARGAAIVDSYDHRGLVLAAPAAMTARLPFVWHVHLDQPSRALNAAGRRVASARIVPSTGVGRALGGNGWTLVAPAITDVPPLLGGRTNQSRVVSAGRLHPAKGYDVLVEAMAQLGQRTPAPIAEIYGAPQKGYERYAGDLTARANEMGRAVRFMGHVPQPWNQWNGAAAYVQPSRHEPFGISIIEAMAAGLAVIASAVDGPSEIIEHERTGLLVPPGDASALAKAIDRLLDDPALATMLGCAGRRHVLAAYQPDRFVASTARVLSDVLR